MTRLNGLRVALLTAQDPTSWRSWSGIPHAVLRALQRAGAEVLPVGPLAPIELRLGQAMAVASRFMGRGQFGHTHSWLLAHGYARQAEARLAEVEADVILALAASTELAALRTHLPVVYFSDATFHLLANAYPQFARLSKASLAEGDAIERSALHRAQRVVFPSRWAAASAISDYGVPEERVHIAPFGANLDIDALRNSTLASRPRDICRLLFLGVDWARKGGDIAIEAFHALRARGVPAELTICGCTPPPGQDRAGVTVIPFLDKNQPEQRARLEDLLRDAHILLLPTRQDCSPIVCSEAAAFGLPVVASRIGGLADIVADGETGILLPAEARGDAYAEAIQRLWADPAALEAMGRAARARYETSLNWDAWAEKVGALLADLAQDAAGGPGLRSAVPGGPVSG